MAVDRTAIVDENLLRAIDSLPAAPRLRPKDSLHMPLRPDSSLSGRLALELLESQFLSRHLDIAARELKKTNRSFYTIGSAGHEGNVVLGALVRASDPTFLHYRSGALMMQRSRQVPGTTPVFDTLLGIVASAEDPISGGRHKVWGSKALWVPPQTSTIASHLPKAVGAAFALERARATELSHACGSDAIAFCNFGDASVNHSVAQGAFNAAAWCAHQRLPLPLLFACEDNQVGISVRTPERWIQASFSNRHGIRYFHGDGLDLFSAWQAAEAAVRFVRERRRPAFLHLETVRLLGHAGSDVETTYRDKAEIEANEARDPLIRSVAIALQEGLCQREELRALYENTRARVMAAAEEAATRGKLRSAAAVIEWVAPYDAALVMAEAKREPGEVQRLRGFGSPDQLPERTDRPRHLAWHLNRALADALSKYPQALIFGEDVGKKGGVYHVTDGLTERFGVERVFNTLLDETTILGTAIGAAHLGFLPIPEIQYLAYLHNAEDQIRGEACSLQFFSQGQFKNPMVIRVAGWAYQKGFGGHFHNDNAIAVLRDIPGLVIASPARPDDAVRVLRTALAKAWHDGSVVVFLEPIALYMTKDLHAEKDGLWQCPHPPLHEVAPFGEAKRQRFGKDLSIITFANGVYLSMRAAEILEREHQISVEVLDLLWLAPLDEAAIRATALRTGRVLIVDEARRSGGLSEAIATVLALAKDGANRVPLDRVVAEDTYIPLGPAAHEVLPNEARIVQAALQLVQRNRAHS